MKDFDIIRLENVNPDRTIKIGGQTLIFKQGVAAEVFAEWLDGTPGNETEAIAEADKFVLACLEPGQEELWRAARSPDIDLPLSIEDIRAVISHILEAVVNRPTEKPSGSSATPPDGGTNSTAKSPSPVAAA